MSRFALFALLGSGCFFPSQSSSDDVVGPFTGPVQRYVVDSLASPMNNNQARELGADLNNDNKIDNQLGMVLSTFYSQGVLTTHGADMIAAGAIASSVTIQTDDLGSDPSVGVHYFGADGADSVVVGGAIVDGTFVSNRTHSTEVPGSAIVRIPAIADSDPATLEVIGMQIDLIPDGNGGFFGALHGGAVTDVAIDAAYLGVQQALAFAPSDHRLMLAILDGNGDGAVSRQEFETNSLIESLLRPDLTLFDQKVLSFGIRFHLIPCESGRCTTAVPVQTCYDRVRDGNETDIDCGGSCGKCAAQATCAIADDCQSAACNGGVCGAPSCSDGVSSGLESDVDCGGPCSDCSVGELCWRGSDCTTGHCSNQCTDCLYPTELGRCQ